MTLKKISTILAVIFITLGSSFALGVQPIEDSVITVEVKAKLIEEKDIPSQHINVVTKDGVVSLTGSLDTSLQADRAIEIASSVDGVIDVIDNLKLKESKSRLGDAVTTAKVKGKIRHLYIYKKIAEGYDLHVETTNGEVHIYGDIARSADTDTITAAAKEVKGVKSVKTNIKVKE